MTKPILALVFAQLVDLLTTAYAASLGIEDLNPTVRYTLNHAGVGGLLAVKILATLLVVLSCAIANRFSPKLARYIAWFFAVAQAAVAIWNLVALLIGAAQQA